ELKQVSIGIAHDLRTPLSRLRQRLELVRIKGRNVGDYELAIDRAIEETDEILATFTSLLRIAEIESGTRRAGFSQVELTEVLLRVAELYAPLADERGQQLTTEAAPAVVVRGDRELLVQMFANLVQNALYHTPTGSRVALTLARDGSR